MAGPWLEARRAWLLCHLQDLHRYCRHKQHHDTYPFLPVHANQKRSGFREADFRMALLQRLNSASMSASCTFHQAANLACRLLKSRPTLSHTRVGERQHRYP